MLINRSLQDDRFIDYIDGSKNMNVQTYKCPSATSVQFNKQYYGTFKFETLKDSVPSLNVGYFKFTTSVPHFARDINIDTIFLRGDSQTDVTFRFNQGKLQQLSNLAGDGLQVLCDKNQSFVYKSFEVYYRGRFQYNYNSDGNIIIHLSEEKAFIAPPCLLVSSIQVNINTCHPSCKSCSGPNINDCLSCDSTAILTNTQCSCKNSSYYFQEGICVNTCDNTKSYFQVNPLINQCEFIKNCKEWDIQKMECVACNYSMLPQQNTCVTACSSGFEQLFNSIKQQQECLLQDRFKKVNLVLSAFHSNEFSGIEVQNISGLSLSNFQSDFGTSAIVSRCGQYQLLGGFYINKLSSVIQYKFPTQNYKYVKVTFKYILIDYTNTSNSPKIKISLNTSTFSIPITPSILSSSKDICGFDGKDIIGTVTLTSENVASSNILLITNSENSSAYFGIREITVYALSCQFDFCSECSSTACTKCDIGYYVSSGNCVKCLSSCISCLNGNSCESCIQVDGLQLNSQTKQCECQANYYFSDSLLQCVKCSNSNCLTCNPIKPNQCLTCKAPLGLLNQDCVSDCGDGMAINSQSNICQQCLSNCKDCKSDLYLCDKCKSGYFYLPNQCIGSCPNGYYTDENQQLCVKCDQSECINCISSTSICSKCNNSYLDPQTSKCVQTCQANQYPDSKGVCQNCSDAFLNCIKCNSTACEQCQSGLYLFQGNCIVSCPQSTVSDPINMICKNCSDSNCNVCQLTQLTNCIQCNSSKFQQNGQCVNSCSNDSYPDQFNNCQPCSSKYPSCKTCSTDKCLTCDVSSSDKYLNLSQSACVNNCELGEYINNQTNCQKCTDPDQNCSICDSNTPSTCLSCNGNKNGLIYLEDNKCVEQCSPDRYFTNNTNECKKCSDSFTNCTSCTSTQCLGCLSPNNLHLDTNTCDTSCANPNQVQDINGVKVCTNQNCTSLSNCLRCNANLCELCKKGNFLLNGFCENNCPTGYFNDNNLQQCTLCSTIYGGNCQTCTSQKCTNHNCPVDQVFNINNCISSCQDGQYADDNKFCVQCLNLNCKTCNKLNSNECLSCQSNKLLENKNCVSTCSSSYYESNQECIKCQPNCLNCTKDECIQCDNNNIVSFTDKTTCKTQCEIGQYVSKNSFNYDICQQCSSLVQNCTKCSPTKCTECNSIAIKLNQDLNICSESCNDGYYDDLNTCKRCLNPLCKTCDVNKCTSCNTLSANPYLNELGECVQNCSSDEFLSAGEMKCIKCSTKYLGSCSSCNAQICLTCSNQNEFINQYDNNKCVSQCPPGQFGNTSNKKCELCQNQNCSTCDQNNSQNCLSCYQNNQYTHLQNQECVSECDSSSFSEKSTNVCLKCADKYDKNCITCNSDSCLSCNIQDLYYLYNNTCILECPSYYYPSSDYKCIQCPDKNCQKCDNNDPNICLICINSYLFEDKCTLNCPVGYYNDNQTNQCSTCYSKFTGCLECTSQVCNKCPPNFYIIEETSECYSTCPFGYYTQSSQSDTSPNQKLTCLKCQNTNCLTCNPQDSTKCISCSQSLQYSDKIYLYNDDCVKTCNVYVKLSNNFCYDQCPEYYLQTKNNCEECPQFIQNRVCVNNCSPDSYIDAEHPQLCIDCSVTYNTNCERCNSNQCLKCSNNLYLYENSCLQKCPQDTFINNQKYECISTCDSPLVIYNESNICSPECKSGYFIEPKQNTINKQIFCNKCDPKCKTCSQRSTYCSQCKVGSGWDCLDSQDLTDYFDTHYCSTDENNQLCVQLIESSNHQQLALSVTASIYGSLILIGVFASHSFLSVSCIYFLLLMQQLGNYVLIESSQLELVQNTVVKYFVSLNIFNLLPNPQKNDDYKDLLTKYNEDTILFKIPNFSIYFYQSCFYQIILLLTIMITTLVLLKMNQKFFEIGNYIKNNILTKLFLLTSNMLICNIMISLYNIIMNETTENNGFNIAFLALTIILYTCLLVYSIHFTYHYESKQTIISSILQRHFLVQSLETDLIKKLFWGIFEFRKIISIILIAIMRESHLSIWISIALNFMFIIYLVFYNPFNTVSQTRLIIGYEIMYFVLLVCMPFMNSSTKVQAYLYISLSFMVIALIIVSFYLMRRILRQLLPKNTPQLFKDSFIKYGEERVTQQPITEMTKISSMISTSNVFNRKLASHFSNPRKKKYEF